MNTAQDWLSGDRVNAATNGELVLPHGTTSAAPTPTGGTHRRPVLLTWQGPGDRRLESARLVLGASRMRALGRVIAGPTGAQPGHYASYELAVDDTGVVNRLSVFSTTAEDERQVTLSRSGEGVWLVEHNQGEVAQRAQFDGALDVDVLGCVLFNALPIRRFGLHRQPQDVELAVVYVSLPELTVELRKQTYRTLSLHEHGAVVEYVDGDFRTEITVDLDGLVIDYPGYARRI